MVQILELNILRMFPRIKINIQGVVKLKCFEELLQHSGVSIKGRRVHVKRRYFQ